MYRTIVAAQVRKAWKHVQGLPRRGGRCAGEGLAVAHAVPIEDVAIRCR